MLRSTYYISLRVVLYVVICVNCLIVDGWSNIVSRSISFIIAKKLLQLDLIKVTYKQALLFYRKTK